MKKSFIISCSAALIAVLSLGVEESSAQQMVYQPKNPAFGGNPMNYQWLMSSANSQNRFEPSRDAAGFQRDPLADFEQSLQRQILSQLTRDIVTQQFGEGGVEEQRFEFGEFAIDVVPGMDGVQIVISNILTGDETSITVPGF